MAGDRPEAAFNATATSRSQLEPGKTMTADFTSLGSQGFSQTRWYRFAITDTATSLSDHFDITARHAF
jgi:hypothetical protein